MNIFILILLFVAIAFAKGSQKQKYEVYDSKNGTRNYEYLAFRKSYFWISYLILAGICFFTRSGVDIPIYKYYYETWNFLDLQDLQVEIGYKVINILLHSIISNAYIGIGIIKLISIGLVFKAIYLLRQKINVGFGVFAYVALLYIYNFQILRMMLAIGFIFLGFSYEILGKRKTAVLLLCLAITFHYSSIIVLGMFLGYLLIGKDMKLWKMLIFAALSTVLVLGSTTIISNSVASFAIFNKYTAYTSTASAGSGFGQFILFIPVALLLINYYRFEHNTKVYILSLFLGAMTFICGMAGYLVSTVTRAAYYFYYFFVLYGGSLPLKISGNMYVSRRRIYSAQTILLVVYLIYRMFSYALGGGIESNGLTEYIFIWN